MRKPVGGARKNVAGWPPARGHVSNQRVIDDRRIPKQAVGQGSSSLARTVRTHRKEANMMDGMMGMGAGMMIWGIVGILLVVLLVVLIAKLLKR